MKNWVLILLLSFGAIFSMQQPPRSPQRGQKRPADQSNAPASKSAVITSRTAFELLPDEIKNQILSFLTTAKGATKRARLDNAAENIRSFFRINKQFAPLGDDPQIMEYLITELANRYANGDKVAAAIALATEAAGKWLATVLSSNKDEYKAEQFKIFRKIEEHFIDAANKGQINVLKFLRKFFSSYNLPWQKALKGAVSNSHEEIVRFITTEPKLRYVISDMINKRNPEDNDETMLFDTVRNDNEEILDLLLKAGGNVNVLDKFSASPLHIAVRENHFSMLKKLLAAGVTAATLNAIDKDTNDTVLMIAVEDRKLEMVKLLLDAKVDVNTRTEVGRIALGITEELYESPMTNDEKAIIKLLKEHGAK
jgi:hypothetical protein